MSAQLTNLFRTAQADSLARVMRVITMITMIMIDDHDDQPPHHPHHPHHLNLLDHHGGSSPMLAAGTANTRHVKMIVV